MSPTGKIRISVLLLGILICLFVASVNGQGQGGISSEEGESSEEGGSSEESQDGGRGKGREVRNKYRGRKFHGKRKFKNSGKFRNIFEKSSDVPNFCNGKACPKFTVVETTEVYELRKYNEAKFLTAKKSGFFPKMWYVLVNYLTGNNAENKTVQIGLPVLKKFVPGNDQHTKMFYTSQQNPPTSEDIDVVTIPQNNIYVRVFGGFATSESIETNRQLLIENIGKEKGYEADDYYVAIYNSPFKKEDRHNEIWIVAKN